MPTGNAASTFRDCLVLILVSLFGHNSIAQAAYIQVFSDNPGIAASVRTSLEYSLLRERLAIMGLSAEEATARLEKMSPAEREVLLAEMGGIQAGGEGDSAFTQALLVFLQVIIIVYFFSFAWLG